MPAHQAVVGCASVPEPCTEKMALKVETLVGVAGGSRQGVAGTMEDYRKRQCERHWRGVGGAHHTSVLLR